MADKPKVLLVDDEEILTRMIKMVLDDVGKYEVETLNNPLEAIAKIQSFRPNIVVLDVIMPEQSGIELGMEIRKHPVFRRCPILFLTAALSKDDAGSWESGVEGVTYKVRDDILLDNPVLTKPVTPEALMAKIDEILAGD
jgi:CheY-like chemotaxis protein